MQIKSSLFQRISCLVLSVVVLAGMFTFMSGGTAYADKHDDKVKAVALFYALTGENVRFSSESTSPSFYQAGGEAGHCFNEVDYIEFGSIKGNHITGKLESARYNQLFGKSIKDDGGCSKVIEEGVPLWGFSNVEDFLKSAGYTKGATQWDAPDKIKTGVNSALRKKLGANPSPIDTLNPVELYSFHYQTFKNQAQLESEVGYDSAGESEKALADSAREGRYSYKVLTDKKETKWILGTSSDKSDDNETVKHRGKYAKYVTDLATKAAEYLAAHPEETPPSKSVVSESAIASGGNVNNDDGSGTTGGGDGSGGEDTNTCSSTIGAIGWLLCPVVNFLGKVTDGLYGLMNNFLELKQSFFDNEGASNTWEVFRTIANILLIAAFLFVIYSQLSGVGISNYGVKRLLPRLIAIAILINLSYFICRLLVDISNLFGGSLYGMINSLAPGGSGVQLRVADFTASVVAGGATGVAAIFAGKAAIAAGAAVIGETIWSALAFLGPILLFAILGIFITFLILIGRYTGIIILTVLAPVAFVMLLFPNTDKYFKKWWSMFIGLLLVYPMISVVFGMSKLVASLLIDDSSIVLQIAALGAMFIPLLSSPFLLMQSMAAMGKIGAVLSRLGNKTHSRMTGSAIKGANDSNLMWSLRQSRALREQSIKRRRLEHFANAGGWRGRLYNSAAGQNGAQNRQQLASQFAADEREKEMKQATAMFENPSLYDFERINTAVNNGGKIVDKRGNSHQLTNTEYAAALQYVTNRGNDKEKMEAATAALARSHSIADSKEGALLRQQAIGSMRNNGDSKLYGSGALSQLESDTPLLTIEDGDKTYLYNMENADDIQDYLRDSIAKRLNSEAVDPGTILRSKETAELVREVREGKTANGRETSIKVTDEAKGNLGTTIRNYRRNTPEGIGIPQAVLNAYYGDKGKKDNKGKGRNGNRK